MKESQRYATYFINLPFIKSEFCNQVGWKENNLSVQKTKIAYNASNMGICNNSWASLVAKLVKKSTCNAGDRGLISGMGRSPGEGTGYPLQYSWASLMAQMVMKLSAMWEIWIQSVFSSVTQSCPTLCDPMNRSRPGFPVHPSPTPRVHSNSCPSSR